MTIRQTPTVELESVSDTVLSKLGVDTQMTLSLGIVNNTGRDLTVINRAGLKFTLRSYRVMASDRAVFFKEGFAITPDAEVCLNPTDAPFSEVPNTAQRLYDGMRNRASAAVTQGQRRDSTAVNKITLDTIIQSGGTVYVPSLDVVISVHSNRAVIHHPYSDEGVKEQIRVLEMDDASLRIGMYFVDNRGRHGPRYINVNGRVFVVPAVQRPGMTDGFYAVHPTPTTVGLDRSTEYQVFHLTVEEAEKEYNLYRTPEEAATYGFSKEAMERENLNRKREAEDRKVDREETEYERKERQRQEAEDDAARKEARENREAIRRDIVDILKFTSAIVITVTGFCATVLKLKKG